MTGEMDEYLKGMTAARHASPRDDLLTRLVAPKWTASA